MEKEHIDPQDNSWVDEILGTAEPAEEIQADDFAAMSAGLTRPEDLEIEKIIAEVQEDTSPIDIPAAEFSLEEILPEDAVLCTLEETPALSEAELEDGSEKLTAFSEGLTLVSDPELESLIAEFSEDVPAQQDTAENAPAPAEIIVPAIAVPEIPVPEVAVPDVAIPDFGGKKAAPAKEAVPEEPAPEEPVSEEPAPQVQKAAQPEEIPVQVIEADELAMHVAGLTHPKDAEIDKIILEMREEPAQAAPVAEDLPQEEAPEVAEPQEEPAPEVPKKAPSSKRKPRKQTEQKGRPKWKKGYGLLGLPHIISTGIWLAIILFIGITLGRLMWVCCADVMAFGKESLEVTITIEENEDIESISKKLGEAGLVRYPGLFKFFAEITGKDDNITFGTYTLNALYDYNAMINAMSSTASRREVVSIMFPDGYTCAQIFALLEEKGVCTVEELENYAASGQLDDYWFLEGVPRGTKYCLEGYLAPDTYTFYTNDEPGRVLEKFLNEFDDRFTDIMKEEFTAMQTRYADMLKRHGYGADYIEHHKLTLHQLVTLASIVEKETSSSAESYDIASVFYNRLANPTFPYLGADATVYYAIGDYFFEKDELTATDLSNSSPYNTRNHEGLPPGPISNPGIYSLYAVLDPNETSFYYYVLDPEAGKHVFTKTYDEHLKVSNSLGY